MKYLSMLVLAVLICTPVSAQRNHEGKRVSQKTQVERTVKCEKACKCVCHRSGRKTDRKHTDRKRGDRKRGDRKRGDRKRGDRKGQRVRGRRFDSKNSWEKSDLQKSKKVRARIAQVRKKLEHGKK